jgi:hypothetical protein
MVGFAEHTVNGTNTFVPVFEALRKRGLKVYPGPVPFVEVEDCVRGDTSLVCRNRRNLSGIRNPLSGSNPESWAP